MTNYKEIIRLQSLGLNKTRIAESCELAGTYLYKRRKMKKS